MANPTEKKTENQMRTGSRWALGFTRLLGGSGGLSKSASKFLSPVFQGGSQGS